MKHKLPLTTWKYLAKNVTCSFFHAWDSTYTWIRQCVPFCDGAPNLGQAQDQGELARFIIWCHHEKGRLFGCGMGEKSGFKKDNKYPHKKARHEGEWNRGQDTSKGEKPKQFQGLGFKPKGNFIKKGAPLKGSQPKGDVSGKPKGTCFNCNEVGHYSKDWPKPKSGNEGFKVIALIANLAQTERNRFIFLKGKVSKRKVLCLFDTGLPITS